MALLPLLASAADPDDRVRLSGVQATLNAPTSVVYDDWSTQQPSVTVTGAFEVQQWNSQTSSYDDWQQDPDGPRALVADQEYELVYYSVDDVDHETPINFIDEPGEYVIQVCPAYQGGNDQGPGTNDPGLDPAPVPVWDFEPFFVEGTFTVVEFPEYIIENLSGTLEDPKTVLFAGADSPQPNVTVYGILKTLSEAYNDEQTMQPVAVYEAESNGPVELTEGEHYLLYYTKQGDTNAEPVYFITEPGIYTVHVKPLPRPVLQVRNIIPTNYDGPFYEFDEFALDDQYSVLELLDVNIGNFSPKTVTYNGDNTTQPTVVVTGLFGVGDEVIETRPLEQYEEFALEFQLDGDDEVLDFARNVGEYFVTVVPVEDAGFAFDPKTFDQLFKVAPKTLQLTPSTITMEYHGDEAESA